MTKLRLAIVGFGKIATVRHVPAIAAVSGIELVAIADPKAKLPDVPNFPSLEVLLREGPPIDAVTLCTPPQVRYAIARRALEHGCHVLLEKPPAVTLSEVNALIGLAAERGRALFATWHSRQAACCIRSSARCSVGSAWR